MADWDLLSANRPDPFVWIDPDDAVFVSSCRDALKVERRAWEAAHKRDTESRRLLRQAAAMIEDLSPVENSPMAAKIRAHLASDEKPDAQTT